MVLVRRCVPLVLGRAHGGTVHPANISSGFAPLRGGRCMIFNCCFPSFAVPKFDHAYIPLETERHPPLCSYRSCGHPRYSSNSVFFTRVLLAVSDTQHVFWLIVAWLFLLGLSCDHHLQRYTTVPPRHVKRYTSYPSVLLISSTMPYIYFPQNTRAATQHLLENAQ